MGIELCGEGEVNEDGGEISVKLIPGAKVEFPMLVSVEDPLNIGVCV